jgi:hypothetical protein
MRPSNADPAGVFAASTENAAPGIVYPRTRRAVRGARRPPPARGRARPAVRDPGRAPSARTSAATAPASPLTSLRVAPAGTRAGSARPVARWNLEWSAAQRMCAPICSHRRRIVAPAATTAPSDKSAATANVFRWIRTAPPAVSLVRGRSPALQSPASRIRWIPADGAVSSFAMPDSRTATTTTPMGAKQSCRQLRIR